MSDRGGRREDRDKGKNDNWIYGVNPVLEAIRSGRQITSVHIHNQKHDQIRNIIETAKSKGVPVIVEHRDFFDTRFQKGHQGVAALVGRKKLLKLDDLTGLASGANVPPSFLLLDGIEDPRNFGAILRVADAAGVNGVIFQSHRSAGITPVVAKASAGALEHVNMVEVVNIKHAMEKMKELDIVLIGAEAGSKTTHWEIDMKVPLAFVVGSEGQGLRKTVLEKCDYVVSLPMAGTVNSLNVSVATGILLYEVMRQRCLQGVTNYKSL